MEFVILGKTNLLVSRTAFGAMSLDCKEIESFGEEADEQPASDLPDEKLTEDELTAEELQEIEEKNILHNTVIAVTHKIYLDKWILQYSS